MNTPAKVGITIITLWALACGLAGVWWSVINPEHYYPKREPIQPGEILQIGQSERLDVTGFLTTGIVITALATVALILTAVWMSVPTNQPTQGTTTP